MPARDGFGGGDVALRVAFALALVGATWNPTGWSFVHWATAPREGDLPLLALAGVTLTIAWAIYLRATLRSIGALGMALAAAFFAALVWVAVDRGLLALDRGALAWVALAALAFVLGLGLSWSHIRRRLSGQSDVDDVDA